MRFPFRFCFVLCTLFCVLRIVAFPLFDFLLPWRPRVTLRSCDMEYLMLPLIFSLPHAWGEGQPTAARCLCCLIPETFRLAHHYRPIMTFIRTSI